MEAGATDADLEAIRALIRSGQWSWDYAVASHGAFFHAPEEVLRLLAVANEKTMQARIQLVGVLASKGVFNYTTPDFSDKEKSQKLAGLDFEKMVAAKMNFKKTLEAEWKKYANDKGTYQSEVYKDADQESAYFKK